MSTLVKALKFMNKRRYLYISAIVIMAVIKALLDVVTSFFVNHLYLGINNQDLSVILKLSIKCILTGSVLISIWRYFTIVYNNEAKRVTADIQKAVYNKALKLPLAYYEQNSQGSFLSRLSYNINKASDVYGSRFRRVVTPFLSVVVYLISMLVLNWKMAIILLVTDMILFLFNLGINHPMKKISEKIINTKSKETSVFLNIIHGVEVIKIYELKKTFCNKYESILKQWTKEQNIKNILLASLESLQSGFDLLCSVLFLGIGIIMIHGGFISLGELVAIYILYTSFNFHFLQIGKYIPELTECLVYMKDLFDFLEIEEEYENNTDTKIKNMEESVAISIRNVSFHYSQQENILDHLSLDFKAGKMTAITGRTGCGKSTLLKLILGFYPIEGEIFLFGKNVKELGYHQVRNLISYVPQEAYLYNASIEENISYGKPGASEEEIIKAAMAANAHDFILKQPDGYQTILKEGGMNLSGGERQRISIARAILKDAPIILMDEATSALDNESEQSVNSFLKDNCKKTIIIVAHRPATIENAEIRVQL